MSISVLNTNANLSGKTLQAAENDDTVTGLKTFSRGAAVPFAVAAGALNVPNLDADKVDGKHASALMLLDGTQPMTAALPLGAAGQITFPAAQNPSANANTLDDYEEGTYTPVWTSGGTPAPSLGNGTISGTYTKVGRLVTAHISLIGGSTTVFGNAGSAWTISLPFAAAVTGIVMHGVGVATDAGVANYPFVAVLGSGGTTVTFIKTTTAVGGSFTSTEPFAWGSGDSLAFTITYPAAN